MLFYVSGDYSEDPRIGQLLMEQRLGVLTSFAYPLMLKRRLEVLPPILRAAGKRMPHMLDSGAFTAWSSGKRIDLAKLCHTCAMLLDKYSDCFDWVFVSLDVIPGAKGRETTEEERTGAWQESARNYEHMRHTLPGAKIKPVFHTGDPWVLAEKHYADADYLGIGMSQNLPEHVRVAFAREAGQRLRHKRLHGLAATGHRMLRATAWHSVDSAAWVYNAGVGAIAWCRPDGKLISVAMSESSPRTKDIDAHYRTLPWVVQEHLRQGIEDRGYTVELLAADYAARWRWNIEQYARAVAAAGEIHDRAPARVQEGLFDA